MLVIAVGDASIAGEIKKQVYGFGGGEESPLYTRLDVRQRESSTGRWSRSRLHDRDGRSRVRHPEESGPQETLDIFLQTINIPACAKPEGSSLALVIALALTSGKRVHREQLGEEPQFMRDHGLCYHGLHRQGGDALDESEDGARCVCRWRAPFDATGTDPVGPALKKDNRVENARKVAG